MDALTKQLLEWIAARPRTYGETINAWRTSCPRFPVWEDAQTDGLVDVVIAGTALDESAVVLTVRGREMLTALAEREEFRALPTPGK